MEIPLQAQVECSDGFCGHSVCVLIDPIINRVIQLVVKEEAPPHKEYIVPVDIVKDTIAGTIQLNCSKAELESMKPFSKTEFIEERLPDSDLSHSPRLFGPGEYYYMPYVIPDQTVFVPVEEPQIPPGELPIRRGTRVESTDGYVGKVDEFVINPMNGNITHLLMREGHLWGQRDVIIPVEAIQKPDAETIHLNLSKQEIAGLPTFQVQRRWA